MTRRHGEWSCNGPVVDGEPTSACDEVTGYGLMTAHTQGIAILLGCGLHEEELRLWAEGHLGGAFLGGIPQVRKTLELAPSTPQPMFWNGTQGDRPDFASLKAAPKPPGFNPFPRT